MELIKSKTYVNLAKTFAGECQARTRYEFMEYGARKEGYKAIAEMIDTVAYNEFNHARMAYTYLQEASKDSIENIDICSGYPFKEKWDLLENLKLAAEDEKIEAERVYPEYAETAKQEGFTKIQKFYENLVQVETCHSKLFSQLYEQMKNKTLYEKEMPVKWKCASCGYEATDKKAWDTCPLCNEPQGTIMVKIEDEN